jgi:N-glycosidase YbiA
MSEIAFTKVDLPYGWLGNMSPYIVRYEGQLYKTAEALFQCMRYAGFPEVQQEIRDQKSPMSAKMVAKKHKKLIADRDSKEEGERKDLERMRECLLLKLSAHPDLKRRLLGSKDALIIEDCSRRKGGSGMFWGMAKIETELPDGTRQPRWVGRNELGKLWMTIREELANAQPGV